LCLSDYLFLSYGDIRALMGALRSSTDRMVHSVEDLPKIGDRNLFSPFIAKGELAESFGATGMEYFNTFGGNPVSCAIANAVLDVIENEKLLDNAKKVGAYILGEFARLKKNHKLIGDIRGQGMFLGLDLVKNRETREPATAEAAYINKRLKENFVLLSADGPYRNVLKFKSPMVFTIENAKELIKKLDEVMTDMEQAEILVSRATASSLNINGSTDKAANIQQQPMVNGH
ncbi:unnamed protein product, partial [Meganyctiphanes norvegica]